MAEKDDEYLEEVPDEVEGPDLIVATESFTRNDDESEQNN